MSLNLICLPVQEALKRVEAELCEQTAASGVSLVSEAARYVLQSGGKKIRPALLLLTARMFGAVEAVAVRIAAAIEMVHAASLMHDDVLDSASLRRGKPAANIKWGNQVSVLVGDFLWCRASLIAVKEKNDAVLNAIVGAAQATVEGEMLEITKSNDFNISMEEHLKIITLKTARLFSCACDAGALLAQAPESVTASVRNYGLYLGMAFQLTDDVLDYESSEERFGKRTGTDLSEGRITLPFINALKLCNDEERKFLKEAILSNTVEASRFKEVVSIIKKYKALDAALTLAGEYSVRAKKEILSLKPSLERDAMLSIADYAVNRGE